MGKPAKEWVLTEDGKGHWEIYDDTYDIRIHCRSQADQDRVLAIIRKASELLKKEAGDKNGSDTEHGDA